MLTNAARWSLGRGNAPVPSRWQATQCLADEAELGRRDVLPEVIIVGADLWVRVDTKICTNPAVGSTVPSAPWISTGFRSGARRDLPSAATPWLPSGGEDTPALGRPRPRGRWGRA